MYLRILEALLDSWPLIIIIKDIHHNNFMHK